MNIAVFSPDFNAYSQTFIQAHKNNLKGNIHYYYGGLIPTLLEINNQETVLSNKEDDDNIIKENLKRSLLENNVQLVLAEFGQTGASNFELLSELQIPLIVHFHGYDAHQKNQIEEFGSAYKEMFKYAKYSIAVSRFMQRKLYQLGCPEDKLVYSTYGPKEIFLNNKPKFEKKQFITIGRFVDKKAPYFTIMAFNKVLEKHPDATLLMGGHGVLKNTCWNIAEYFNIRKSIRFLGVLSHEKVAFHFSESLAYVQHSMEAFSGDCEGTPVVIIEACGAGIPVVSTLHAGIPDVVKNGYSGILVKEGDVQGMAEGMITLASNFDLAKKMGECGRHIVLEEYTMDRHIDFLNNLILSVIEPTSTELIDQPTIEPELIQNSSTEL